MSVEWLRDLSIIILCFVTTVVFIFGTILAYRLYRSLKSILSLAKATSEITHETITQVQERIRPLLSIFSTIQGTCKGFKGIGKMFG